MVYPKIIVVSMLEHLREEASLNRYKAVSVFPFTENRQESSRIPPGWVAEVVGWVGEAGAGLSSRLDWVALKAWVE